MSGKNLVLQLWPRMLSANQIAVFFDDQSLWKGSIDLLDFFALVAPEATTFGCL